MSEDEGHNPPRYEQLQDNTEPKQEDPNAPINIKVSPSLSQGILVLQRFDYRLAHLSRISSCSWFDRLGACVFWRGSLL
jgi:hypothetical protein